MPSLHCAGCPPLEVSVDSPLVSVIVSAYNRPEMLLAALNSIFAQSYQKLEIIIQDDSPEDGCQRVVEEFGDSRIRYTRNYPSLGTLRNLRCGYRRATGKYVCTLNDDDLYAEKYIETMVRALEDNPSCCLSCCDHFIFGEDGLVDTRETDVNSRRFGRDRLRPGVQEDSLRIALMMKSVPGMFAMYRATLMDFSDFPDEVSSGYDFWITYLAVRSGQPIFYSPERLTFYRVHPGSQTSSFTDPRHRFRSLQYDLFTHQRFLGDARLRSIHPAIVNHLAQVHLSMGSTMLRLRNRGSAVREFLSSLRLRFAMGPALGMILAMLPHAFAVRVMNSRATLPNRSV